MAWPRGHLPCRQRSSCPRTSTHDPARAPGVRACAPHRHLCLRAQARRPLDDGDLLRHGRRRHPRLDDGRARQGQGRAPQPEGLALRPRRAVAADLSRRLRRCPRRDGFRAGGRPHDADRGSDGRPADARRRAADGRGGSAARGPGGAAPHAVRDLRIAAAARPRGRGHQRDADPRLRRAVAVERMTDSITLYDSPGSPCARRVRAVLLEKGLAWITRLVDLTRMEQKRPEYLALNPNGVVPTLVHGDRVLYESNVITEYLDDVFPEPPLYPRDPWGRAQAKMWQAFELAMAKDFRPLMYARVIGPYDRLRPREDVLADARRSTDDPAHLDWVRRVYDDEVVSAAEMEHLESLLLQRLDRLEAALAGRDWLVRAGYSIADLSVAPRVQMYPMVQIPLEPRRHPRVCGWLERVAARPAFARSQTVRPD